MIRSGVILAASLFVAALALGPPAARENGRNPPAPQPVAARAGAAGAEARGWADALRGFWDPTTTNPVKRPRIRPVGGDSVHWGLTNISEPTGPAPADLPHVGPLWMMESWHNVAWAKAKMGDPQARRIVSLEWAHIKTSLGLQAMGDGTTGVHSQDDSSWKALYLAQVVDILRDRDALQALQSGIPAILSRFKDTSVAQVDAGNGVRYSPLGVQYDTVGDGGAGQSSTYEIPLMLGALSVWDASRLPGFLNYAKAGSDWLDAAFRQRKAGKAALLARGIVLIPSAYAGAARGTPINGNFQPEVGALANGFAQNPVPGGVPYLLAGNMAAAVLNARLYHRVGNAKYLARALALVAAIGTPDTQGGLVVTQNVTTRGVLMQGDPWSDAAMMVPFVNEVLTLPGADPNGACAKAIAATAASIVATADGSGFYGADWWGSFVANGKTGLLNGYKTFQARAAALGGKGKEADRHQIMTTANTLSVLQAAALLASRTSGPSRPR